MVSLNRAGGVPYFDGSQTVPGLLETAAAERPDHVFCRDGDRQITCADLDAAVNRAANGLAALGVSRGDRVAMMLGHHIDHVVVFFAIMKLRAVIVPVNVALKGPSLAYQLSHSGPVLVIADGSFEEALHEVLAEAGNPRVLWRGAAAETDGPDLAAVLATPDAGRRDTGAADDDVRIILYTSGTTGAPKGVLMTDRMVMASALGSIWLSDMQPGCVLHFWDPIYHVFGAEVLVLALMVPVTLVMIPRFSASNFWKEVRDGGVTHIHFVGGVLQLLLKQPPGELDVTHGARIAWGGGCPRDVWKEFEERFAIRIREGYGMTETSSFSTINPEERFGSIGRPVDYFEMEVVDAQDRVCAPGVAGEIRVRGREPHVLTAGYFNNPEATAAAIRGGWLYTGDLAHTDEDGFLYYHGRKKDSLRRRGENISAWEVERVVNAHPDVAESALIGVKSDLGDDDLKIFVRRLEGSTLSAAELIAWCAPQMPKFQLPRYVAFVEDFRKTPTQRIQKQFLPTAVDDGTYDAEAPGGREE